MDTAGQSQGETPTEFGPFIPTWILGIQRPVGQSKQKAEESRPQSELGVPGGFGCNYEYNDSGWPCPGNKIKSGMPARLGIEVVSKPFWNYFNLQSRIPSEQYTHDTSNTHQLRLKTCTPSLYSKNFDKKDNKIAKRSPLMAVSPKLDGIFGMLRELGR